MTTLSYGTEKTVRVATAESEAVLDGAAAAFSMSAGVTAVFNTVLAWAKDLYAPLNDFMASLTGHHWRTHGIFDLIVFVAVGFFLMQRQFKMNGNRLAIVVASCAILSGAGLAGYFLVH